MRGLGDLLVERGLVTDRDLTQAIAAQKEVGGALGSTLVRLGALSENDLLEVLSEQTGFPIADSATLPAPSEVQTAVERTKASMPWLLSKDAVIWFAPSQGRERLHCASRDPQDLGLQDAVEQWSTEPALFFLASQQALEGLLEQLGKAHDADLDAQPIAKDAARLREMAEEAPVIDFVNAVFAEAIRRRASDVHIEPFEDRFVVRLRVDGILSSWRTAPRSSFDAVASRLKLLSGMDIAERRLPQDGRQSIRISGREVDLRVSSLPTTWGESLVLRLLGKTQSLPQFAELGVLEDHQRRLASLIAKPHGVLLVTGPTGSGKTTTIYRLLSELNDGVRKIITVEDPVEFDLPGVMQVGVRSDIGLSFASGLRSILRQDPDVILVGEIRDSETAKIAVQAALTGHLVISTVHTNSAVAAIPRLLDLGVEEFLLADVVRGLVGQRLVRRLCRECARANKDSARRVGFEPKGCPACSHTGYSGRIGIYEVIEVDDALADAIRHKRSEKDLRSLAHGRDNRDMKQDGVLKVERGETTMSEVLRVIGDGSEP